jgi:hypothetical protein
VRRPRQDLEWDQGAGRCGSAKPEAGEKVTVRTEIDKVAIVNRQRVVVAGGLHQVTHRPGVANGSPRVNGLMDAQVK